MPRGIIYDDSADIGAILYDASDGPAYDVSVEINK
jgi:hypothetical protein